MRLARGFFIFSYGLFTIAGQSLVFREFITSFEGSDISVGVFFASWFLWVGLGAVLVYRSTTFAEKLLENIEVLLLLFLPAFLLQLILIIQARELAGIESYALLPIRAIVLLSLVVNAPISIITGMLFPTACRWVQQQGKLPVSRVYILEAAGSFVGGLGVTVLLAGGASPARIFFILAFIISVAALIVQPARIRRRRLEAKRTYAYAVAVLCSCVLFCAVLCLGFGVDKSVMRYVRAVKWIKLLPKEALRGSFQTPQAEYLYGIYNDQWVAVREGSVVESVPDESTSGRIAAISLCQNPEAERILVIGSGLGVCREFLRLGQIKQVTWAHCDNEYVHNVSRFIPEELKVSDKRFDALGSDVRGMLAEKKRYYDIVVVNLPDATSSVLNRYYTLEFYRQVKQSLRADGVLALRIAGGENIMGTELINLGASTKLTLEKVFSRLVLTPGEDTWFIASDSEKLTGDPGTLQDRFAGIVGGADVFAPQGLLSVYLPARAATAVENYASADLPEGLLVNRDSRPLTHLYSLLLAAKQSGAPVTRLVKHLALAGPLAFVIPVMVFAALRVFYILRTTGRGRPSSFDSSFLVFSAGWAGIGVVIVLMYLYQTRFGSLYLHIGVISSVYMVGLTAGAAITRYLLVGAEKGQGAKVRQQALLFVVILLHALVLAGIGYWPSGQATHLFFAVGFVLCGLCGGCYFPLAAGQLRDCGFESGQAASKLETADHLGASVGGLMTGLLLVPVLGTRVTLLVLVLLMAANVPGAVVSRAKAERVCSADTTAFRLRRLGYALFGIGASLILCSNVLAAAGRELAVSLPYRAAQALAGELRLEGAAASGGDGGEINYFKVHDESEKVSGYIFSSEELAPEVRGFGGRMNLAIYVDADGRLIDFHIIRSNETPAYLELLGRWRELLNGRALFQAGAFSDIDAVTGATVSCEAIVSALEKSGRRFAAQILGRAVSGDTDEKRTTAWYLPDAHGTYLMGAVLLGLIVIYYGGFWSRLCVLLFNLVLGGILLNAQYSSEQIATVLSLHAPAAGLTGAFLLAVGVPVLVIFFGNIYCGYMCPFGAAQELLGYVVPASLKPTAPAEQMRQARFVKYAVLFVLMAIFFLARNRTTLAADPLIEIFNLRFLVHRWRSVMAVIAIAALVGSVFYTRFWCRYLCPAGAFLSLLNNLVALKRYLPPKRFGKCEFGLTAKDKMDCIYCDRCRHTAPDYKGLRAQERKGKKVQGRVLVACAIVAAIVVSTVSARRFLEVMPTAIEYRAATAGAGGEPRDVDLKKVERMIRQKKLSDREAEFYKQVE